MIPVLSLLMLLLVSSQAFAAKPSLKAGLNNEMLSNLKDMSVKKISNKMKDIHLPDLVQDLTIAQLKATNIIMHIDPFGPKQVSMQLIPSDGQIGIKGNSLSLRGDMNLEIKTFLGTFNCKGFMNATGAGFDSRVTLLQNGTRLSVKVISVTLALLKENVNITIKGDVIGSVLDVVAKYFKDYFFANIVKMMGEMLPDMLSLAFNDVLGELPDDVPVNPDLAIKFAFTSAPTLKTEYMVASVLAYLHLKSNPNPPAETPPDMPDLDPNCHKGLQVFFSDYIVRSAVDSVFSTKMMTFAKSFKVLGFKVDLKCDVKDKPKVKFNGSIAMDAGAECTGDFKWSFIKFKLKFIIGFSTILNEWINKSVMKFNVLKLVITTLKIISGKELDMKKLLDMLNLFIEDFRGQINKQLESKGIPIPVLKNYDFSDVEQKLVGQCIFMCGTLKPKSVGDNKSYYLVDPTSIVEA
ncbi:MAG: hypothetical protein P4M11_11295 [Candidatus Pacebacteria bacterium]|nr:hypothetical protein [Candidatus Paceibacterota bacterium]